MLAALDETYPEVAGSFAYVVGGVVVAEQEATARAALARVLDVPGRTRPFHWHREGPRARLRLIECMVEIGAVAHACVHYPTSRSRLEAAREAALRDLLPRLVREGASDIVIESRGRIEDARDRSVILDAGAGLRYDWRTKREPLLWLADGVCGAVREHLVGSHDAPYFGRLVANGVLASLVYTCSS